MRMLECCHRRSNRPFDDRSGTPASMLTCAGTPPLPGRCGPSASISGFTLIEILVVLVIIGLLAGVALPRLYAISQRYEIAAQRQTLLTEISSLGYRAYNSGHPIELGSPATSAPVKVPTGWRMEIQQPIHYSFNGICSGGQITLLAPDAAREDIQLKPPACKPTNSRAQP